MNLSIYFELHACPLLFERISNYFRMNFNENILGDIVTEVEYTLTVLREKSSKLTILCMHTSKSN